MHIHLVKDPYTRQQQLNILMMGCFAREKEIKRIYPQWEGSATITHIDDNTVEIHPTIDEVSAERRNNGGN